MDEMICYFFSFLIEGIVFWNYVSILFVPKCSAKIRFVCLSSGFFILFLFSLHNIFLLNCILYTTVCFLYLIFLYKTSWYYALFIHSYLKYSQELVNFRYTVSCLLFLLLQTCVLLIFI